MAMDQSQTRLGLNDASACQVESSRTGHTFNNVTITGNAVLGDVYGANGDMLLGSRAAQQREGTLITTFVQ